MLFGLTNAPAMFQRMMDKVLAPCREFALPYIYDVLIYLHSAEEHLVHLEKVFKRLRAANLKIKLSKCKFFRKSLSYLGYLLMSEGLKPDPKKCA